MKKFTFIISLLLVSLMATTQNSNLPLKIQKVQQKFDRYKTQAENFKRPVLNRTLLKNAEVIQKLDSTVSQLKNGEIWQNDWKDEFMYNTEMKNSAVVEKEWNVETQSWSTDSRTEMEYNSAGNVNSMMMYYKEDENSELLPHEKLIAIYDTQGRLDTVTVYSSDTGSTWKLDGQQVYHFNSSGQLIQMDFWSFEDNGDGMVFSNNMKMVYTYTSSGQIETSSTYYMMEGDELLYSKTVYAYNNEDKLISTEESSISFATFELEKSWRTSYEYNATGDVSAEIDASWDEGAQTWIDSDKYEYSYNNTNASEVVFPSFNLLFYGIFQDPTSSFTKLVTGENSYEMQDGNWVNSDKTLFYYSEGNSTKVIDFKDLNVSVFPNPATESVKISWKGNEQLLLEIYQITGSKVLQQNIFSGKEVSISQLQSGIYIYKLINGNDILHSGKLIKY